MKTIRHSWESIGFLRWECKKCGVVKERINGVTWFTKGGYTGVIDPGCVLMNEKIYDKNHSLPH